MVNGFSFSTFLILFCCAFTSSLSASLECPEEVNVNQEFSCDISLEDGVGLYDIKFEIKQGSQSVAKVFENDEWKSAYYYLIGFLEGNEEKQPKLMITKQGKFDAVLKVRQLSKIENFNFSISALEVEFDEEEKTTTSSQTDKTPEEDKGQDDGSQETRKLNKKEVVIQEIKEEKESIIEPISLNSNRVLSDEEFREDDEESSYFYLSILGMSAILIGCCFYLLKKL